jgi:hypothetical protein
MVFQPRRRTGVHARKATMRAPGGFQRCGAPLSMISPGILALWIISPGVVFRK